MAHIMEIEGIADIKRAMKMAKSELGDGQRKGLIRGGLYLQGKSQEVVPVKYGTLKASAGTEAIGRSWWTDVVVYYTASYAVYVHEVVRRKSKIEGQEGKLVKHKPGKMAKFLETPARRYRQFILMKISGEMEKHMRYVRSFKGN